MTQDDPSTPLLNTTPSESTRFKWVPVEIVVILYFLATISISPIQQYYVISVIAKNHNDSSYINQGSSNCTKQDENEDNDIQKESTDMLTYMGFCSTLLSVVPILFLGAMADRFGRKFVICICLSGQLLKEIVFIVVIHFELSLYFLYIGLVIEALTGGFGAMLMAIFGIVADITTPGKNRAFRIAVIEGVAAITAAFAILGIGYWIKFGGFYFPMLFAGIVSILAIIFSVVFIPETSTMLNHTDTFFTTFNLLKSFKLYIQKEPIGRRKKLIVALLVLALSGAAILGRSSAQTLYLMHYPLCWSEVHIQIYSSIQTFTNWGGVIIFVRILHLFTQDYGILVIGSISSAASMLLFGFATKDWLVYLYAIIGINAASVFPMLRAMMSRLCNAEEQGSLFATIGSTELLFTACSQLAYGGIYRWSVSFFPGLVFVLMAGVLCFVLVMAIILSRWMSKSTAQTWQVIN